MSKSSIPLATYNLIASQRTVARQQQPLAVPDAGACPVAVERGVLESAETSIRCDIELARIALALKQSPLFRVWLLLHEQSRQTGLQGFTRAQLDTALASYGVKGCSAYITRLIHRGIGFYWNVDTRTGKIYPAGYFALCKRIITRAMEYNLPDLYTTNGVGQRRDMYLHVAGTNTDFESQILSAWYASRNNPMLSRMVLCALFNRTEVTIRKLERRAGVQVLPNLAETTEPAIVPLQADGTLRPDVKPSTNAYGQTVYTFNLSNTYHAGIHRQHPRRGQARRAASWLRDLLDDQLTGNCGAGGHPSAGKLKRIGRHYCETWKAAKQAKRRGISHALFVADKPAEGGGIVWGVITT